MPNASVLRKPCNSQGELYEKLGKTKEAAEAYRRLAELDGNVETRACWR